MKKHLFILFLLLGTIWPTARGLSETEHSPNVFVDPRMELLAVVQLLSGYGERYGLITRYDFRYKRDVMEYFSPHKNHPAVKLFAEMSATGFSYDAPPAAMLRLSEPPDLTLQLPFTGSLKKRAGSGERLNRFVSSLRDFARETNFTAFFQAHKGGFQAMVAVAKEKMEGIDYIGPLENYYGMKQHSYNIILVPLFRGAYGPRIKTADGTYDIYNITGPTGVANGIPTFGSAERFRHLAWHEFSHSFVNPITGKFHKEIAKYSSLYNPISDRMKQQAYGNWQTCVNEHIVRAVQVRLTYREIGKAAGYIALLIERGKGFCYVAALCERLKRYESHRDKYPTFVDFYPRLVDVFKELSEKDLGDNFYTPPLSELYGAVDTGFFTGPINAAVTDRKSAVLIIPTDESDKAVQDEIHAYVKRVHDRFFKDCPILKDKEALEQDLSSNTIIVFGTTKGNLWLAQHIAKLPVRIESSQIVADTVYSGTRLGFITAWPNPQNPKKGMVIYTAQQAEDVIDINFRVFHGPTDYVIAKDRQILKEGNYKKQNGRWTFK